MGNKVDLNDQREVEISEAEAYAEEIGALFIETSAKTDTNVSKAFIDISSRLKLDDESVSVDADDGRGMHMIYSHTDYDANEGGAGCCR